ncbi:polycystin family receptor for egg jelly-like [Oculina patagonica]
MTLWLLIPALLVASNGGLAYGDCNSYSTLDSKNRLLSKPAQGLCDNPLSSTWYRFTGPGSYLPESCPETQSDVCGTSYPGWLNGIHPTAAEGVVTRTVCFSQSGGCCQYTTTIEVQNCGDFYVYKLVPSPTCNLGYCATDVVPGIPAECTPSGYNELNESNRYWGNNDGSTYCDSDNITSNQWYRFTGDAGTMMATYCIPKSTCNTQMSGWIRGGDHPTVAYETVTRTACMHWSSSCCYTSYTVEIRNCSGFYVYKLKQPSGCDERYCGVNNETDACSGTDGSDECTCEEGYQGAPCREICISYKTLDTADRNVSTPYHGLCDSYLATKWYRFTGDDGFSYLPESCPQPQQFICGTSKPGWLNGIHPTPAEGIATRTVCYSDNGGCCIYSNTIQVKNCGNFFVYKLAPSPTCNLGYCVTNVVPSIPPAECTPSGYKELNDSSRYWTYNEVNTYCDADNITSNQWYRFTGDAGTMMATYCIPQSTCGADMTGWISGGDHPTVAYETVTRSSCMHWSSSCCYTSYTVEIRNCSGFYVYKLKQPSSCPQRYCGVNDTNEACSGTAGSATCTCEEGFAGLPCEDINECEPKGSHCDMNAQCNNTIGSFNCTCLQGFSGDGFACSDIDECVTGTHNCHVMAHCYNSPGSFSCECWKNFTGDGVLCEPMGNFSVTIKGISRDKYHPNIVKRTVRSTLQATIAGLPGDVRILKSVLEWSVISEMELETLTESAVGVVMSRGKTEWTIKRRSVPTGFYLVKFTAAYTVGDPKSPQTLTSFNYGFIKFLPAPVKAVIDGGSSVRWGSVGIATVDGSLSYDEDIGPGNRTGLSFIWSCLDPEENDSVSDDCFGSFYGVPVVPYYIPTSISIDPGQLEINKTYVLRLNVTKGERSSHTEISFEIVSGDIPQVALRCFVDCGAIVSASNKFRVTSECANSPCIGSVYKWRLKKMNDTNDWEDIPILDNMTSTAVNATNMIIKKNTLQSNATYRLMLFVTPSEGTEGFAMLDFETAGKPHGGNCTSSVREGVSLETRFIFECFEWKDKSTPISYEFRLGEDPISYGLSPKSASTVLPVGSPEDDYQLQINIVIKNFVGVAVVETLFVKVKPSPELDPCLSEIQEVAKRLTNFVIGEDSELDKILRRGNISQAVQLARTVITSANEKTDCGRTLDQDTKTLISNTLVKKLTSITPENLQMARSIMTVLILVTENQQNQTCASCKNIMDLIMNFTDSQTKLLISDLNDIEQPFSAELEESATSVTDCLTNVLRSASGSSQDSAKNQSSPKGMVQEAAEKLDGMSDAFFARLVPSEDLVIRTPELAIALKKVSSDDIKGLNMEEGPSRFKLPGNLGNIGGGNVNAKMQAIHFNPFTWDNSSKKIKSSVISLDLQSGDGIKIGVSNLDSDIEIVIPISSSKTNKSNETEHHFLKPNKMTFRSYFAELADVPVSIKLGAQEDGAVIKVFVKNGSRPTIEDSDHNFTLVFTSTCKRQTDVKQNKSTSCVPDERSVTVVPPEPSLLYVGLLFLGAKNVTEHSRKRRSCFGHGRERRSCVGVKDPPPKGVTSVDVPKYDPSTDVNYTFSISQSSCLYWSEDKDKWTSDGCRVDASSNTTHLKCLCNHLTSFGGNFIQAPNPIDFDKVFTEFTRLGETGNISVLVTIACAFLLYFVAVIFARRADKRDENKIGPPKCVRVAKEGAYFYDMVISTGIWKHSGTTANVTMSIDGEMGELNLIPLRSDWESSEIFARGGIDGFVIVTDRSLGPLTEITLAHDNSGEDPSWFVETVVIKDRQTGERWVFPINRWLAVEKDDGEIEVTVDNRSTTSFSDQVRSRFGRKIADSHLWMSVFGKACSSTFTRVQRASCCLSVFFSAMIANAMFYNIGGESDGAIQIGPFKFSWRQIVIGVQSGLIIAPINILIVFLFKSSRPKSTKGDKYKENDQAQQFVNEIKDTGCTLPHFCVYIGWFLCFATTLTAAAFTLFYSLMWGKEVAEQWLASILISSCQDIFVVQPTKVMLAVIVIALLLTRNKDTSEDLDTESDADVESDIDFLCDNPKERFKRDKLEAIRKRTKKEAQLTVVMRDIVLHLTFVFFLAIVCYGNKNENRFLMTTTMINPFMKFDLVTDSHRLWGWLRQEFLPNIYSQPWYNGRKDKKDVYIGNKMSILIGMPWMRQLRIKKSCCKARLIKVSDCYNDYTPEDEDTTLMSLPEWRPLPHNTSWPKALKMCPKPWRYQTAEELSNDPIKAPYTTYEGGGYVAVMGYKEDTAHGVLSETLGHGWVDRQTRAVILEFVVFNVNTNLISIATYFYEVLATGAAYTAKRVDTLELYSTESGALMFYLICQFLFIAMVLFNFIVMLIRLYRQRLGFFKSVWNMVDFLMIISSLTSVVFYMVRSKNVLKTIKAIQANPYEIVHFHSALDWASWENASIAVAIFMVTLKLLNLIRFNPYVIFLFSSFRQSVGIQLSFVVSFLIIFNAFAMAGMQFFGHSVFVYSSFVQAVISQFEFLLGKAVPLDDLRSENQFLGPTFVFIYNITMTVVLINMLVSVLNESYTDAKTYAEDSAEELEMARFIGERFMGIFQDRKMRNEFKLFCDDSTFVNMCSSDAEPYCLNSQTIIQCTEERLAKMDKRLSVLSRRTENIVTDHLKEEVEYLCILNIINNSQRKESTRL